MESIKRGHSLNGRYGLSSRNNSSVLSSLEAHYHQATNTRDYIRRYFHYLSDMLERLDTSVIEQMIEALAEAAQRGKTIYLAGNGGSAATASHMANDLAVGAWLPDYPPFRVVSLTDNVPVMTAIANDTDYTYLFASQLRSLVQPGDILLVLSVSGNSPNVLEAVRLARERGALTIGCCGFSGGDLQGLVDICLHVPSEPGEYGPVEDVMMILNHAIHSYFMFSRQGTLRRGQEKVLAAVTMRPGEA